MQASMIECVHLLIRNLFSNAEESTCHRENPSAA